MRDIERHVPVIAFVTYATYALFSGLSWATTVAVLGLGAYASFWRWNDSKQKFKEIEDKLESQTKELAEFRKALETVASGVSSIKLGMGMRNNGPKI